MAQGTVQVTHTGTSRWRRRTGEYASLTAALEAAADGDVLTVAPGTYRENLVIARAVTLRGPEGSLGSVRIAPVDGVPLTLRASAVVQDLHVEGQDSAAPALLIEEGAPELADLRIVTRSAMRPGGARLGPAHRAPLHRRQSGRRRYRRTRRRGRRVRGVRDRLGRTVRCLGARRRTSPAGTLPYPPLLRGGAVRHGRGQRPRSGRLRDLRDQGQRNTGGRPRLGPPHRLHRAPHLRGRGHPRHRRGAHAGRLRHPRHPGERGGPAFALGPHPDPLHGAPVRPQRALRLGPRYPGRREPVRDPRQHGRLPGGLGQRRCDGDTGFLPRPRRAGRHLRARPGLARRRRGQRSLPDPQHGGVGERRGDGAARRLPDPGDVHRRLVPRPRERRHPEQLHHRCRPDGRDRHQGRRSDDRALHGHLARGGRLLRVGRGPRHLPRLPGHRQRGLRFPRDGRLPYDADPLPHRALCPRGLRVPGGRRPERRVRHRSGRGGLHQRRERAAHRHSPAMRPS